MAFPVNSVFSHSSSISAPVEPSNNARAATINYFASQGQFQSLPEPLSSTHNITIEPSSSNLNNSLTAPIADAKEGTNYDVILESTWKEFEDLLKGPGATATAGLLPHQEVILEKCALELSPQTKIFESQKKLGAITTAGLSSSQGFTLEECALELSVIEKLQTTIAGMEQGPTLEQSVLSWKKQIEKLLKPTNTFFKDLLEQPIASLSAWMKDRSDFINRCSPFSISNLFQNKLQNLRTLSPFLNDGLVKEWAQNYPLCFARLKENGLTACIDQKTATSQESLFDFLISTCLPSLLSSMMGQAFFKAGTEAKFNEHIAFDSEIIKRHDNPVAIIDFIEKAKKRPDYSAFFYWRHYLPIIYIAMIDIMGIEPDQQTINKWLEVDVRCEQIMMNHPKLRPYLNEETVITAQYQMLMQQQEAELRAEEQEATIVAEKLGAPIFKQLLAALEGNSIDRPKIEQILLDHPLEFFFSRMLKSLNRLMNRTSNPLDELYMSCCFKLIAAGFKHPSFPGVVDLEEFRARRQSDHVIHSQPTAPAVTAPALSVADQIKRDIVFFKELFNLLTQKVDTVDTVDTVEKVKAWLKEKNGNDYLVRGKQNKARVNELLTIVDREVLRSWNQGYNNCVEKLNTEELKHLLPQ